MQGNAEGQYGLGRSYYGSRSAVQNYARAVYWFTKAAEQGFANAQFSLGNCYYNGKGVTQDYAKAFYWFTKAVEQGLRTYKKKKQGKSPAFCIFAPFVR